MSIRDYLKRRTRRILAIGVGGWLLLPLSAIVSADHEPPWPLAVVGVVLFGGAVLSMLFLNRCPKCRARLGQLSGEIAFHWGTRARVNFCPYCGVSLDAPYEPPRTVR